ncbi:MAG: SURF1 family protein [Alphaproteobacteria bacterium]
MQIFLQRPGAIPILVTAAAVLLCTVLGFWQLQRRDWKHEIIDTIETNMKADPVVLPGEIDDPAAWDYRRVSVTGTFRHDKESYLQAQSRRGNFGWQIITPLLRADGTTVMVNRGWVPYEDRDPSARPEGQVDGVVTVSGIARLPWRQGWIAREYVFDNDPVNKVFYEGALGEMAAAHELDVLPLFVDADDTATSWDWPKGGQTVLKLRDNHLMYAIQWFLLAIAGIVIFVLYHRKKDA